MAGFDRIHPIANEDLDRTAADKTASVHFMRFELSSAMAEAMKAGAALRAGIDHPAYPVELDVPANVRDSLAADLA